jgi:hypothetical protein
VVARGIKNSVMCPYLLSSGHLITIERGEKGMLEGGSLRRNFLVININIMDSSELML